MTIVAYLKQELGAQGDFFNEWKKLSTQDKIDLKTWAAEEMSVRGIEITEAKK
jgi:hypothetical protein